MSGTRPTAEITDREAEQFEAFLVEKGLLPAVAYGAAGGPFDRLGLLKKALQVLAAILPIFLGEAQADPRIVGAPRINWETIKRLLDVAPQVFTKVLELVGLIRGALDSPEFAS